MGARGLVAGGLPGRRTAQRTVSNQACWQKALRDVRSGDILLAHLGIWSRKDPWAPAVLEPLITGLKASAGSVSHPARAPPYAGWIAQRVKSTKK
jgi:hypothetical protein